MKSGENECDKCIRTPEEFNVCRVELQNVKECDATDDAQGTEADNKIKKRQIRIYGRD